MKARLRLTRSVVQAQIVAVASIYDHPRSGRGSAMFGALHDDFHSLEKEADALFEMLEALKEDQPARPIERELERILQELEHNAAEAIRFRDDIGRRDLPAGLLHLIDRAVIDVYSGEHYPIIHLHDEYAVAGVPSGPMVVNLPSVHPACTLWSPIIVHELAHPVWKQFDGRSLADLGIDLSDLQAQERYKLQAEPEAQRERQVLSWAEELYCDAVAAYIAGPAFLIALASRAIGRERAESATHPPYALRIKAVLNIIEETGWFPFLNERVPAFAEWLRQIEEEADETTDTFLDHAMRRMPEPIRELAKKQGAEPLTVHDLEAIDEAIGYFRQDVLPVEVELDGKFEWKVVLAGWMRLLEGDHIDALATAPRTHPMNGYVGKTVELRRIVELWDRKEDA